MALVARSICLSYDENAVICNNMSHQNFRKWVQFRSPFLLQDDVRMKLRSNERKLSYTKLIGDPGKFHHSKSAKSGLILCGWEVNASKNFAKAIIPKVLACYNIGLLTVCEIN